MIEKIFRLFTGSKTDQPIHHLKRTVKELPIPDDNWGDTRSTPFLEPKKDPLAPPEPEAPQVGRSPLQDMAEHQQPDMIKGKRVDHTADHSHGKLQNL